MAFDPPMALDSENEADRTFLYCSVFDNGANEESPPVKRYSESPMPPDVFGGGPLTEFIGGPCYPYNAACLNPGPNQGQKCFDHSLPNHSFCDSVPSLGDGQCSPFSLTCYNPGPMFGVRCGSNPFCDSVPGADDGVCDACPVHGGVTTEDEMFILLGNYFIPEPETGALGAAAALALAGLARRRRS
jgi:hypothetical protein